MLISHPLYCMHAMQVTVRLGGLGEDLTDHLDKLEEETGYRPNKSDVIRDALATKLASENESSGSQPEDAGGSA